jgi:hypothetical protein
MMKRDESMDQGRNEKQLSPPEDPFRKGKDEKWYGVG